jgi:AraC family transcriptional regulator
MSERVLIHGSDGRTSVGTEWCVPVGWAGAEWEGLPVALWPIIDRGEKVAHYQEAPVLLAARSGTGKRWYRSGTVQRELRTVPRVIEIYGADFSLDHGCWEGTSGDCVGVEFPAPMVSRLLQDEAHRFQPGTRFELFDDQLADLVFAMWEEASTGSANGRIFAQGLSLALLGLLAARYGVTRAGKTKSIRRLSSRERKRIQEFIDSGLETDLSVERLAAVIGMSPYHFSRMFKATFGRTPHSFVLDRRIDTASVVLRIDRNRPIADIALAFGFATQAHFTQAFRRRVGATPPRGRRGTE